MDIVDGKTKPHCSSCNDTEFVTGEDGKPKLCNCYYYRRALVHAPKLFASVMAPENKEAKLAAADFDLTGDVVVSYDSFKVPKDFVNTVAFFWLLQNSVWEHESYTVYEFIEMQFDRHPVIVSMYDLKSKRYILRDEAGHFPNIRLYDSVLQFFNMASDRDYRILYLNAMGKLDPMLVDFIRGNQWKEVSLSGANVSNARVPTASPATVLSDADRKFIEERSADVREYKESVAKPESSKPNTIIQI